MTTPATIDRDELQKHTGLSGDQIRKMESKIGLRQFRCKVQTRPVRYNREQAVRIFRGLGFPI